MTGEPKPWLFVEFWPDKSSKTQPDQIILNSKLKCSHPLEVLKLLPLYFSRAWHKFKGFLEIWNSRTIKTDRIDSRISSCWISRGLLRTHACYISKWWKYPPNIFREVRNPPWASFDFNETTHKLLNRLRLVLVRIPHIPTCDLNKSETKQCESSLWVVGHTLRVRKWAY